jgi:hypothetical protein
MTMLTVDWTEVGAIATAVGVVAALGAIVLLVLLTRASRRTAAAIARLADTTGRLVEGGRSLKERSEEVMDLAARQVQLSETRAEVAHELLLTMQEQVEISEQGLVTSHPPVLVPVRLAGEGEASHTPLEVMLPDGVYYAPLEQSAGAWTVEPAERKLVVSCAFVNVGIGPAVLHPYHRIDIVRRESLQPLVSFGGFAGGVAAVGSKVLAGFPLSAAEPSFGATLMLLDRPDEEIQLMVTLYYRSSSSSRPLWTRARYQRHLRTSPAGLLSEVALELSAPDEPAS